MSKILRIVGIYFLLLIVENLIINIILDNIKK